MNSYLKDNVEYISNLYGNSREGLVIVDEQNNIVHSNYSAKNLINSYENITSLEHRFSFDVCALNEDDILKYNPVSACIKSKQAFITECFFQLSDDKYKNIILRSFNLNNFKVLIITDLTEELENHDFRKKVSAYQEEINNLQTENQEHSILKERAESQAIRTGLINRISSSIRDTLDIDEIIKTAVNEISLTLGVHRGLYASYDKNNPSLKIEKEWHINKSAELVTKEIDVEKDLIIKDILTNSVSQLSSSIDITEIQANANTGHLRPRLATPVIYQGEILGIMIFYHINQKRIWHKEEVSLVEGIAAQLAAAVYQAKLFEKLENQKSEIEQALVKLRETQAQLVQSEKMASLGQLVAGVAHEINTPLGAINSNINVINKGINKLRERMTDDDLKHIFDLLDEVNSINNEAVSRINTIVKTLKNFARLDEAELQQVDIHEGIKSTLLLINHEIKNRVTIIEEFGDIPPVKCYPNHLNQVFMNLFINACQSIDKSGTITIKTKLNNDKVMIIISDTGKGIEKENLDKIFNPGYTTKGVGVGTGLGLSICYQIIEKHKGTIKVESQVGLGTVFTVELPIG